MKTENSAIKILLVDDKPANLFALEKILNKLDVDLFKAQSGSQALNLLLDNDFALVLLDVQMPGMDGYELADLLRAEESTRNIPIIFLTAIDHDESFETKGYRTGAVDFMFKPLKEEILLSKVKVFIELHRAKLDLVQTNRQLQASVERANAMAEEAVKAKHTNQGLEEAVRERTQELEGFSYSVSHDLRAPLRAVDGFSKMLQKDYGDTLDKEGNRLLEIVRTNVQRMGTLIDDLLSFSRLGRKAMHSGPVDMNELARDVYAELKAAVPERQIKLDIHDVAPASGDRNLIQQVFINLISNAIKFTGERDIGEIEIWSETKDELNVYCVKDNGAGFDMQYADKLFGVFQRLHSDEEFEGTGIGLALVQRIIKRHDGSIWAESEPDKGATFHFTLPPSGSNAENEQSENKEPAEMGCC